MLATLMAIPNLRMMKATWFRITAGLAAVYHLVLGAALLVMPAGALGGITRVFLGTELEIDARMGMVGKFSSAYLLAFGVMLALLCLKPQQLRALVIPALVLFGIRLANKLVFMTAIEESFDISRGRSLFAIASLALIFVVMAWTRPTGDESRNP